MINYRLKYCFIILVALSGWCRAQTYSVSGIVKDSESREPLPFATIQVGGTTTGATTNVRGAFSIQIPQQPLPKTILIISFIGYRTDTLIISPRQSKYTVLLRPDVSALQEVVVVSGTMKEVTKMNSPIPVEVYSPALFLKNPTPSIFESLGMVNGVQPQLNCNVCNTGDIHINGMEGPYTMILVDGMPIVSSLATVYGLSGIPNSMVKRIEVVKGPASTLYGSEAVGGLINIITKDASSSSSLQTDISATSLLEYNADLTTKWKIKNAQSLLGVNYFNFRNKLDINEDNFTDITQQQRISIFNKWDFHRKENRQATAAFRYVYEDRWEASFNGETTTGAAVKFMVNPYTNRVEFLGKYQLPIRQAIIFDYSYNYHLQDSYYGTTKYLANQHVAFTQLRWDRKIGNHELLVGLPFRFIFYDDNTAGTSSGGDSLNTFNNPMQTFLPGIFIQDEFAMHKKLTVLTGLRYDHHNHHGNIFSPRVSFKFAPDKNNTIRLSTGNGFRVVNLFTEDHAALTGARTVIIANELKPEQSWNINLNYAKTLSHASGFVGLDASVFYTYFTNKIIGDFRTDPALIIYDNLSGHAISKGVTLNTDVAFINSFKILAGLTVMNVYQVEKKNANPVKIPQLFAPQISGTYALSYALDKNGLAFDLTGRLNGPMHLPTVPENGDERPAKSPWFTILNFQITKTYDNGLEFYGGAKNILNFIPKDPLYYWQEPFAQQFDTSYNYAPLQGIKAFAGIRYTLN